jgi:hypothetical protein
VAYDEALAERVRSLLAPRQDVTERKMFGGITWMLVVVAGEAVTRDDELARWVDAGADHALSLPAK